MGAPALFPPLRTIGTVAFIDDDRPFLDMLEWAFQSGGRKTFHQFPGTLSPWIERSAIEFARERDLIRAIVNAQDGGTHTDSVAKLAHSFFANAQRLDLVDVLVVDYDMPSETGVELCSRVALPGLRRILLTGFADQTKAISAFNENVIEFYLPKQSSELTSSLADQVDRQRAASLAMRGAHLLDAISSELQSMLAESAAVEALHALLRSLNVNEHMLLGAPSGLLALSSDRKTYWIQLETAETVRSLVDALRDDGWPTDAQERVAGGNTMINIEWAAQLGIEPAEQPTTALLPGGRLTAAVFPLDRLPVSAQPAFA